MTCVYKCIFFWHCCRGVYLLRAQLLFIYLFIFSVLTIWLVALTCHHGTATNDGCFGRPRVRKYHSLLANAASPILPIRARKGTWTSARTRKIVPRSYYNGTVQRTPRFMHTEYVLRFEHTYNLILRWSTTIKYCTPRIVFFSFA